MLTRMLGFRVECIELRMGSRRISGGGGSGGDDSMCSYFLPAAI